MVRGLRASVRGRKLGSPALWRPDIVESDVALFAAETAGRTVQEVERRGKWILFRLSGSRTVLAHLRMTGRFRVVAPGEPKDRHDHLQWPLGNGEALRFSDVRRFGRFRLLATPEVESYLTRRGFGPEPLEVTFDEFARRLGGGRRPIKSALLDQRVVSGIGNIYADEILFAARISPLAPVSRLSEARRLRLFGCMQTILRRAIECSGTTIANFISMDGRPGDFGAHLAVFRRTGSPCPRCGRAVRRLRLAGRSTHYCGLCQRP